MVQLVKSTKDFDILGALATQFHEISGLAPSG
jgi:hypothetical protein